MPTYLYTARTKAGVKKTGEMSAPDEHALALLLREQGLLLTKFTLRGGAKEKKNSLSMNIGRVPPIQKILFTQHLSVMLDAGLSLSRALQVLAKQAGPKSYFAEVITEVQKKIEGGSSFADALKEHPKVFQPIFVSMVRLGESSGNLSNVLQQLNLQMKKNNDLVRKIRGAMYYPAVIMITMLGIIIMLVTYVLPKLIDVFEGLGADLPLSTRMLIKLNEIIQKDWLYIIIGSGILIAVFILVLKTNKGKSGLSKFGLKIPKIGGIIRKINIARFCRTFSAQLKSGVQIVDSLRIVADTMGNASYNEAVIEAAEEIKTGTAISKSFMKHEKIFPPIVTQIMAVGEETGTLDSVLTELADFYEEEVDQELSNISSIIEPILMLVLGGGVALLAISIIGPIYSLSGQI